MSDIFAVRDVDEDTKRFIHNYARRHKMRVGKAMKQLVYLAQEHLKEKENGQKKKFRSLADRYDEIKFGGKGDLSDKVDEIVYGV